jgi:hypothetical protein
MQEYNKMRLHQQTYYEVRKKYPTVQSLLVQCARDQASAALKLAKKKKFRCKKSVKTEYG